MTCQEIDRAALAIAVMIGIPIVKFLIWIGVLPLGV